MPAQVLMFCAAFAACLQIYVTPCNVSCSCSISWASLPAPTTRSTSMLVSACSSVYRHILPAYHDHRPFAAAFFFLVSHASFRHIGGTYNDKEETLHRFAANFRKLSPNCQACSSCLQSTFQIGL